MEVAQVILRACCVLVTLHFASCALSPIYSGTAGYEFISDYNSLGGAVFCDFDGDGHLELFDHHEDSNPTDNKRLWYKHNSATWSDESLPGGIWPWLAGTDSSQLCSLLEFQALCIDLNADGVLDAAGNSATEIMLATQSGGSFSQYYTITKSGSDPCVVPPVPSPKASVASLGSSAFFGFMDYNLDGLLDIIHNSESSVMVAKQTSYGVFNTNQANQAFNGNIPTGTGGDWGCFLDYNNDNCPDIILRRDQAGESLWKVKWVHDDHDFVQVGTGTGFTPVSDSSHPAGVVGCDLRNNGFDCILWAGKPGPSTKTSLWCPDNSLNWSEVTLPNYSGGGPISSKGFTSGLCHDFDNDGWLDIILFGENGVVTQLLMNQRGGNTISFLNLPFGGFVSFSDGVSGAVCADIDDDGDVDCYLHTLGGSTSDIVLSNDQNGVDWLKVYILPVSYTEALNRRIWLVTASNTQITPKMTIGAPHGYGVQYPPNVVHFGVSTFPGNPNGVTQTSPVWIVVGGNCKSGSSSKEYYPVCGGISANGHRQWIGLDDHVGSSGSTIAQIACTTPDVYNGYVGVPIEIPFVNNDATNVIPSSAVVTPDSGAPGYAQCVTNPDDGCIAVTCLSVGTFYWSYAITDSFGNTNPETPITLTCTVLTASGTPTGSGSTTATLTSTPTPTGSDTTTSTLTQSITSSTSNTLTSTPTPTGSDTTTNTLTSTPTSSSTNTLTSTGTPSTTNTPTATPTPSNTGTSTGTPTTTNTRTSTPTNTPSTTNTRTATQTPSTTMSLSNTQTRTGTPTPSTSKTRSHTPSSSHSSTQTLSSSPSTTHTISATNSVRSRSPSSTVSHSGSSSKTSTISVTPTASSTFSLIACPQNCGDNNICTLDYCDMKLGECVYEFINEGEPCVNDPCVIQSQCKTGLCIVINEYSCNDNDVCTDDHCVGNGECAFIWNNKCTSSAPDTPIFSPTATRTVSLVLVGFAPVDEPVANNNDDQNIAYALSPYYLYRSFDITETPTVTVYATDGKVLAGSGFNVVATGLGAVAVCCAMCFALIMGIATSEKTRSRKDMLAEALELNDDEAGVEAVFTSPLPAPDMIEPPVA